MMYIHLSISRSTSVRLVIQSLVRKRSQEILQDFQMTFSRILMRMVSSESVLRFVPVIFLSVR